MRDQTNASSPLQSLSYRSLIRQGFVLLILSIAGSSCHAWSNTARHAASATTSSQPPRKVLVTGASGKTGRLVLECLLKRRHQFYPKALVRCERSARRLLNEVEMCPLEDVMLADVTSEEFVEEMRKQPGLQGLDAMIVCTSAMPRLKRRSFLKATMQYPFHWMQAKVSSKKSDDALPPPTRFLRSLKFKWKLGKTPLEVDYNGQVAQIELAKALGVKKVVVISSMGGTNPDHFLNKVGEDPVTGEGGGILKWKRRAEEELIKSGLSYTILHPGGLVDEPAGEQKLLLDVDDRLGQQFARTRISRADVAELSVAALTLEGDASFDCIARPTDETPASAEEVLWDFLQEGKTATYEGIPATSSEQQLSAMTRATKRIATVKLPQLFPISPNSNLKKSTTPAEA